MSRLIKNIRENILKWYSETGHKLCLTLSNNYVQSKKIESAF